MARDDDSADEDARRVLRDLEQHHVRSEPASRGDMAQALRGILNVVKDVKQSVRMVEGEVAELRKQQQENLKVLYGGYGTPIGLTGRVGILESDLARLAGKSATPESNGKMVQLIGAAVVVGGTVLIGIIAKWIGISVSVPGG